MPVAAGNIMQKLVLFRTRQIAELLERIVHLLGSDPAVVPRVDAPEGVFDGLPSAGAQLWMHVGTDAQRED
jgi:hypothetical protein